MAIEGWCTLRLNVGDEPSCGVRLQLRPGLRAGALYCVPSMIDSLEVEVLYPA